MIPDNIKAALADFAKSAPQADTQKWIYAQPYLDVEISIEPDEYEHLKGAFSDERDTKWVKKQLNNGNMYAWCQVLVHVEYRYWDDNDDMITLRGSDALGGCSYKDKASMKDLFDEMAYNALHELARNPQVIQED